MGTKGTMYLGIDGGGTRCRARIEDENGSVLGVANSGPATMRIGFERAWRSIMEATEAAAAQAGLTGEDFARMYAGIGLADAAFAPIVMRHANQGDPVGRRIVERAADAIGDLLDLFLARGIDRLSLVGGLADVITPWLTPDLRARLKSPDADAAAGALLVARGRLDLPKRETDHEQTSKFRV
ncbi:BadF/BadG/BcrA/BcrD ATPase family protein [Bradyrhizobium sp. JYMT SZCCT0428]|uniref:BadF/BadG/BcrA/BcrD ATPase family protein n=1 Tax=Bradyrhizobium sp. JYMT SZCCT0428 TaxID=2807673 RepID=UPI001BAAC8E0|nr:BadF/BadG/BcrA/BcrD ATPase family protein [Bradyrhizobium sp. JYMT SZCCT0428]MBR1153580.1 hypothetical protein [Bradyrhizobium sp. JYMT SZCCT0428]